MDQNHAHETYYRSSDDHNQSVDDRQCDLARRGEVPAPVEMQPVDTTKSNCDSQYMIIHDWVSGLNLQLNQLAKRELWNTASQKTYPRRDTVTPLTIKLNKLLKVGIPSAMIHAIIQQVNPMPTHDPTETRSRWPMRCGELRKIRT